MRSDILVLMTLALGGLVRPAHTVWAQTPVASGTVITVAGNGTFPSSGDGGQATDAGLTAYAVTAGPDGRLYIAEEGNYRIRAIDPTTGVVSTVAGNGSEFVDDGPNGDGGPATSAQIDISPGRRPNLLTRGK
jgi:hypothetical protein